MGRWLSLIELEWICTYPVPFHAHTHFLASLGAALILDAGQAVPAPPPVALRVLQDLHHAGLVDGVESLIGTMYTLGHKLWGVGK